MGKVLQFRKPSSANPEQLVERADALLDRAVQLLTQAGPEYERVAWLIHDSRGLLIGEPLGQEAAETHEATGPCGASL